MPEYSPEERDKLVAEVCRHIVEAADDSYILPLGAACRKAGVSRISIWRWRREDDRIDNAVRNALEMAVDAGFELIQDLAETSQQRADEEAERAEAASLDATGNAGAAKRVYNKTLNESYQQTKLRIDAIKWVISRMAPNKYGERRRIDVANLDPPTVESGAGGEQ